MSALGQKQTIAVQNGMSALPPKADIPNKKSPGGIARGFGSERISRSARFAPSAPSEEAENAGASSKQRKSAWKRRSYRITIEGEGKIESWRC